MRERMIFLIESMSISVSSVPQQAATAAVNDAAASLSSTEVAPAVPAPAELADFAAAPAL